MSRSKVVVWWVVGLALATFSNSLALTRTGLSSYFDFLNRGGRPGAGGEEHGDDRGEPPGEGTEGPGGGTGAPGGDTEGSDGTAGGPGSAGGEPTPPPRRPSGGDEFRRHVADWSLREEDWTRYSPYFPGIPGRGGAPDQTSEELGFQRIEDDNFIVFHGGDEALERSVLQALARAVPRMLEVYGNFPFPKFYNGRKIPV